MTISDNPLLKFIFSTYSKMSLQGYDEETILAAIGLLGQITKNRNLMDGHMRLAIENRNSLLLQFLISKGGSINTLFIFVNSKHFIFMIENGATHHKHSTYPLWESIRVKDIVTVEYLLTHGSDNIVTVDNNKCLKLACDKNNLDIVKLLIEHGADPLAGKGRGGKEISSYINFVCKEKGLNSL